MTAQARERSIAETATLVHGFTMADVDHAARIAVKTNTRCRTFVAQEDRYPDAWHGVVEELYRCGCGRGSCDRTDPLSFRDLIWAGRTALDDAAKANGRNEGKSKLKADGESSGYQKYWLPIRRADRGQGGDGFTDALCERLALRPALSVLTGEQYEALATLAAHGSHRAAAAALGMALTTYDHRVRSARKAVLEVWFQDETPPRPRAAGRGGESCRNGHLRSKFTHVLPGSGKTICIQCRRNRDRVRVRKDRDARAAAN